MLPVILIHGPTASGKTALAIELARRLDGEIVNADAMQVYADLETLTARPTDEERSKAPHHLYGHVDAAERYSVARWLSEAKATIDDIRARGKSPIVVGGTGLYLQALAEGLSDVPEIPDAARAEARRAVAAGEGPTRLAVLDPDAGRRIPAGDRQRLARALEVVLATGRPLASYYGASAPALSAGEWLGVALTPERRGLYRRIDARVDAMLKSGAADEARRLYERGLPSELPVMRAHGMPGFCEYFAGRLTLSLAAERAMRDTRRYAKRQMTWIAHQFTRWPRVPSEATPVRTRVVHALLSEIDAFSTKR